MLLLLQRGRERLHRGAVAWLADREHGNAPGVAWVQYVRPLLLPRLALGVLTALGRGLLPMTARLLATAWAVTPLHHRGVVHK